jgi:hypothetical protein
MNTERAKRKIKHLDDLIALQDEKLFEINKSLALETDPSRIFKYKQNAADCRAAIDELESERIKWKDRLHSDEEDSLPIENHALSQTAFSESKLHMPKVPTGYYHLLNREHSPLMTVHLTNKTQSTITFRCQVQIQQYSNVEAYQIKCEPNIHVQCNFLPTLVFDEVTKISELRQATLQYQIESLTSGKSVDYSTRKIELHARNTALLAIFDPADDKWMDYSEYLAAWVTPNHPVIQQFLNVVRAHHPQKILVGYQNGSSKEKNRQIVNSQAQAIYDSLKDSGFGYINSVINFGTETGEVMQRIRLPRESLEVKGGNCIDGTVLFASLLLAISLNPAIMLVPGHAFVGWETWKNSGEYECLETTLVGSDTFDQALAAGNAHYKVRKEMGDLDRPIFDRRGFLKRILVKMTKAKGITPME